MSWWQIVITVLGLIIGNGSIIIPLFLWIRSEANADRKEMTQLISTIQAETKDFHARLCIIEERNSRNYEKRRI